MDPTVEYLYRGTTPGWPGSPPMAAIPRTPTTTDPLVATLFAIKCLNFGKAVILIVQKECVAQKIQPANSASPLELEIALEMTPSEFESRSVLCISVDNAREALTRLGYPDLPVRIANDHLSVTLEDSESRGWRLSASQIVEFNHLVMP